MKSIRRQLTRELVLVLALLLGVGLVAIYVAIWQMLVASFDATLHAQALAVSALTESEAGRVQFDFSNDFLHEFGAEHPRSYFELRDSAGGDLKGSPSLRGNHLPFRTEGTPDRPIYWNLILPNGRKARAVSFSFSPKPADDRSGSATAPLVRLVVAADSHGLNENLGGMFAAVAGGGGLLLLAVILAIPHLLKRGLVPLNQLGEQVARIDATSLAVRFPTVDLSAELQPIANRLNDLLARLEVSFERERRFSADLAHEFRTPVAELRSLAECSLKWPDTRDAAADRDFLAIAAHMEMLITSMLTLARGECGSLVASLAPVEFGQLVTQSWQQFAERAATRQLRVSLGLTNDKVTADPVLLRSILSNLFDNAVAYAPAGTELRISGRKTARGYEMQIANSAAGLVATDLPLLFDRFWRKESSRSGDEHSGLGLSLARTFANAMGWQITAELDAQGWLIFTLATTTAVS